jgi:hypothetical protein
MLYEYTSPWAGFELISLVVIGTDCIGNYKITIHNHDCWCLQYRYFFHCRCTQSVKPKTVKPCMIPCARDCILTAYSDWSVCSASCYKGKSFKGRVFLQPTLDWSVCSTSCYKGNCIKGRVFLQPTLTGQFAQLHATKVIVSKGDYSYSLLWLVRLLSFMLQR